MIIILMISSTVIRPIYTTIIVAIIHYGNEVNIKKNEINIERKKKMQKQWQRQGAITTEILKTFTTKITI